MALINALQSSKMIKLMIMLMSLIFILSSVDAFSINTFNNSLTSENLFFNNTLNITRYLSIPQNIYITNASITLLGISQSINNQTSFNISFLSSDSVTTNNITLGYAFIPTSNINVVNGTIATTNQLPLEVYIRNSSKDVIAKNATPIVSGFTTIYANLTANQKYYYEANLSLGVGVRGVTVNNAFPYSQNIYVGVINITNSSNQGWDGNGGNFYIYSVSGLGFDILKSTAANVTISIGNNVTFNSAGPFTTTNKTSNFALVIDRYLSTCSYINGYCNVPINFSSSINSTLQYSALQFDNSGFSQNNITYNATTYETKGEAFSFNLTYDPNYYISSNIILTYNNTNYTAIDMGSGYSHLFVVNLYAPVIGSAGRQDNMFYWTISLYNGSSVYNQNTSLYNQTDYQINLTQCDTGNKSLIFKSYDEQNLSLKPFSFDSTFDYYLGDRSFKKTLSITNSSANEIDLCISQNIAFFIDSIIAYKSPSPDSSYVTRNHFYQKYYISGFTQNINLLSLKGSASTSFVLNVLDENDLPLGNVLIDARRCYSGTGLNQSVFIHRTDSNGFTTGNFEAETALYQFYITNDSNILLAVAPCSKIVPQTTPYTLIFQLGQGYNSPILNVDNVSNVARTLYFNTTSNIVTFTYIDTSGSFKGAELIATSLNTTGSSEPEVCDNTLNISSGIITCNLTKDGTYTIRSYIYRTSNILTDQIIVTVQTLSSTMGYYGVFLGFLITLVCCFMFKWNEIAAIWLTVAAQFFNFAVGFINWGWTALTAMTCVAIIITAVLDR